MTEHTRNLETDALNRILGVARQLGATSDLGQVLSVIIDAMRDLLDAERATVFEHDREAGELFSSVAHGLGVTADGPSEIRIPETAGLAGESAQTRSIINVPDAHQDPRFNRSVDDETGFRTRSLLTIPLEAYDGELIGVAQVLNKRSGAFTEQDTEIAGALAAQAAVAIKRARLIEDQIVREKLERDLELARQIQLGLLPVDLPRLPGFEFAAWTAPADQTGGDIYDLIGLIDADADEHLAGDADTRLAGPGEAATRVILLVADATGHGIGSALSVVQARSLLRMAARLDVDLERIGRHLNDQIRQDVRSGRFITAWLGELHAGRPELFSFSPGQAPLLHYVAAADRVDQIDADAPPLGIAPLPDDARTRTIRLEPGDVFAVISDGVLDATDRAGTPFETDRAAEVIRATARQPADAILGALIAAVETHADGVPAADDRTVLLVQRVADA